MAATSQTLSPTEVRRWTRMGVLAALCMLLGYVETFVPLPVPGVKLGLANIPVLVALAQGDLAGAAGIAGIKVLATGLLFGSPLTMAYSAAGTTLAVCGMVPLSRLRTMRLWMLSIVGALLHEAGQLGVATLLLGTTAVWYASPVLILAGCVTGAICGVLAQRLLDTMPADGELPMTSELPAPASPSPRVRCAFLGLVVLVVAVFHVSDPVVLAVIAGALAIAFPRGFVRSMRLTLMMGALALITMLTTQPETAFVDAGISTLRLSAIATASMGFMRLVPAQNLAGIVAWLCAPFARLGLHTDGFVLAFSVALGLLPTLEEIAHDVLREGKGSLRPRDVGTLLPRIMHALWQRR